MIIGWWLILIVINSYYATAPWWEEDYPSWGYLIAALNLACVLLGIREIRKAYRIRKLRKEPEIVLWTEDRL